MKRTKQPSPAAELRLLKRLYEFGTLFAEGDDRERYLSRAFDYLRDRLVEQPKRDAARKAAKGAGG